MSLEGLDLGAFGTCCLEGLERVNSMSMPLPP